MDSLPVLPDFKPLLAAWLDGVAGAPKETPLEVTEPNVNPPVCGVDVIGPAGLPNWKPLPGAEPKVNPADWVAGFAPRFKPPVLAGWVKPPMLPGVVPKGKPPVLPGAAADVVPVEPNEKPIDKQQKDQTPHQVYP